MGSASTQALGTIVAALDAEKAVDLETAQEPSALSVGGAEP